MDGKTLSALSLALGLGLLIGLQRERAQAVIGGIRTFPLVALFGAICGLLAGTWGAFVLLGGLIALTTITLIANLAKMRDGGETGGQTTEIAVLVTYTCGALLTTSHMPAAIVVGGLTAVLLHMKRPMHAFAGRLSNSDVRAIMRFAIVSLIVLPLLPDQTFDPYDVLSPREIWWMVVLIVGLGLAGYVSYRLFGQRAGAMLGGILGGLVSSTATTVAYARRTRDHVGGLPLATAVIQIASTIAAARVIVEVAIVAPRSLLQLAPPLAALFVWMAAVSFFMVRNVNREQAELPEQGNPAELRSALIFAALFAVITLVTAAAKIYFGPRALFAVAIISGFVDVDAITLSTAQLLARGQVQADIAWRVILIATLSNLVFKAAIATVIGGGKLLAKLVLPFGSSLGVGLTILLLW